MADPNAVPPGYVAETMKVRDALVSPDEAIREAAINAIRVGAAHAIDLTLKAYVAAALDEDFRCYRARMN